ncbi:hypothetical protein [Amycolatopsis sp. NPDC051102]|uniref:hypothetical protein n=1 Tax=Amycolatopsis sp. NPDC051102 TaxID=3155163 RepID=UPI0034126CFE
MKLGRGSALVVAPAAGYASTSAACPVTPFRMEHGASVLAGSITWYDRSIHATGFVKAVSSGKTAVFQGESPNCLSGVETRTASGGETRNFVVDLPCDFPGGITVVHVELWDTQGTPLHRAICLRNGCAVRD